MSNDTVTITVVRGPEGHALYIDDTRFAGPKWREGQATHRWVLKRSDVESALRVRPDAITPTPTEQHE